MLGAALSVAGLSAAKDEVVHRYALVIGSNQAGGQPLPALHHADDDALNNCELLAELGMQVRVFTEPDKRTRARRAHVQPDSAKPCSNAASPYLRSIEGALTGIVQEVRSAPQGVQNEIVLWFSGHGDGNALFLHDQPLTTARLRQLLIAPTRGFANVHVILDACNATQFVTGRGEPSEDVMAQVAALPTGLGLDQNSHVGALIAATEFNKVHEYSALEAGIFSYELRAALRNAADATGDRKVSYREAEAFVWAANAGVESVDARMYGQAYLPRGGEDQVLADWTAPRAAVPVEIVVPAAEQIRFRVNDARGIRLVETHKGREEKSPLDTRIFVDAGGSYQVEVVNAEGQVIQHRSLEAAPGAPVQLLEQPLATVLSARSSDVERSLDKGLFQRPFDTQFFEDYRRIREQNSSGPWLASRGLDRGRAPRSAIWPYLALGAVATGGLATGIAFNLQARDDNGDAQNLCEGGIADGVCRVTSDDDRRARGELIASAKQSRTISYIGFGAAAAALVTGVVLFFVTDGAQAAPPQPLFIPQVAPGSAGLLVQGRF